MNLYSPVSVGTGAGRVCKNRVFKDPIAPYERFRY